MNHKSVHEYLAVLFPSMVEDEEAWYENGKNSIRVRLKNKREFIFSFNAMDDWKLQTKSNFLNELKGEKQK